ncbi:hypothetical protein QF037_009153 [Streptomyces canus]|nr:hypothetical protein [Streptomyces canus]
MNQALARNRVSGASMFFAKQGGASARGSIFFVGHETEPPAAPAP